MNPVTCRDCINFSHEDFTSRDYYAAISDLFSIIDDPLTSKTAHELYASSVRIFSNAIWKIIRSEGIQEDNQDCRACSMRMWSLEFVIPFDGCWPSNNFFRITCNGSILTIDRSEIVKNEVRPIYVLETSIPGYNGTLSSDICVATQWDSNGRKSSYQPLIKSRSWMDKARFGHLLSDVCIHLLRHIQQNKFNEEVVDSVFGTSNPDEVDDEL